MARLKSCPRCRGTMLTGEDVYGVFWQCLQCGHLVDLGKPKPVVSRLVLDAYPSEEVA